MYNQLYSLASLYLESSKEDDKEITTPEELLKWMDCIQYGWMDKDNKKYTEFGDLWWKKYTFLPPDEVEKYKVGTCYEQAIYASHIFDKLGISHKVLWAANSDKELDDNADTHAFLIYKKGKKWFWFEHSWGPEKGIHGPFDSIDDLKEEYKKRCDSNNFWFTEMDPKKYKKRIGGEEFYNSVLYPYIDD